MTATIKTLPHYFPEIFAQRVILSALIFVALCVLWAVLYKRKRIQTKQFIVLLILSFYVVILYYYTVVGRYSSEMHRNQIYVFYSYRHLFEDFNAESIRQIVINIVMLIPIGLLCPIIFERTGRKYIWTMITAGIITISIEVLQVVMVCGTFEADDIINNLLGATIGIILYRIAAGIVKKHKASKGNHYE